ncbi:patatin-like phospholipase family protein [Gluconacetobacter tumulisoli]|uniref:Patatin-like phospholipase family protein n=1 Tax=Gluconacetobacter tumulisoli TaxID=1286189 RepID=A0A7W4KAH2_9PROT|nr:patatin-like phospholipase family protein [Gluconacetobacter tumulisoli]
MRDKLRREHSAAPVFCIQGGGARGAWEAGVLAGLLKSGKITTPCAIWGTSAGALNALWSRDPSVQKEPLKLLDYWTTMASRFICLGILLISCILMIVWCIFYVFHLSLIIIFAVVIFLFSLISILCLLCLCKILKRLPGILPSSFVRLIIPRPKGIAPGWFVYTCVANVDSQSWPEQWEDTNDGWFFLKNDSSACSSENLHTGEMVDAFDVAVASASIPGLVRPTRLSGMTLLDGGLVANLPAGFILTNGATGGAYVLCIVPRAVEDLSHSDPIDRRTLDFLVHLKDEQEKHRSSSNDGSHNTGPAHALIPIFIISPKKKLKSGLCKFWCPLLRREFKQGNEEAIMFSNALKKFAAGNMSLMQEYLLENVMRSCEAPTGVSRKPLWLKWVNTRW